MVRQSWLGSCLQPRCKSILMTLNHTLTTFLTWVSWLSLTLKKWALTINDEWCWLVQKRHLTTKFCANRPLGCFNLSLILAGWIAFSALTLLAGHQEDHMACENWMMRCWCDYMSGVKYKWFASGQANVTATPSSLSSRKPTVVTLIAS